MKIIDFKIIKRIDQVYFKEYLDKLFKKKMKNKVILVILLGIFILSFSSAQINLERENIISRNAELTGNEIYLWNLDKINLFEICLTPIEKDLKDISLGKEKISYPTNAYLYSLNGQDKTLKETKNVSSEISKDGKLCFSLNPFISNYQLFDNPIYINSTSSNPYNLTKTNTSTETNFTHLNISDPSIVLYMPFDYPKENGSWVAGNFSRALSFDGVDDYVTTTLPIVKTSNFTWCGWFKPSVDQDTMMMTATNYIGIGVGAPSGTTNCKNDKFCFWTYDSAYDGVSSSTSFSPNVWYHVCGFHDASASTNYIYVNGVNENSTAGAGTITGGTTLALGGTGNPYWLKGTLDEVKIFNYTLNQSEIDNLYANNTILNPSALNASYSLDDNTGFNVRDSAGSKHGYIVAQRTGKEYDYSNNSNDGTASNGASYTDSGVYGGAYTFDGSNDYVSIADSNSLSFGNSTNDSAFTISAWIYMKDATNFRAISKYTSGNEYYIVTGADDKIYFALFDASQNAYIGRNSGVVTAYENQWIHIVGTYNGSSTVGGLKIYINGTQADTSNYVSNTYYAMENTVSVLEIGKVSTSYANGSMDELMIFNKSLSASEVSDIYNNQSTRFFPTGEMLFQNLNFSTNNSVNITLEDCQANMGSRLKGKINNGNWNNFSGCSFTDYQIFGGLTNANFTIGFVAGNESNNTLFYSPLVIGNITLNDYTNSSFDGQEPVVTIISPLNYYYGSASVLFNISATDSSNISACWYSIGGANISMTNLSTLYFNATNSSVPAGTYTAQFWCNDTAGNVNVSSVVFWIDLTQPTFSFETPTPENNSYVSSTTQTIVANVSDSSNSNSSSFIDFDRSLVGYWGMDYYNSTGIFDNSSYSNFGTFTGAGFSSSNISQGKRGQGLNFDGSNDYIQTSSFSLSSSTNSTTISAWVKNPFTSVHTIFNDGSQSTSAYFWYNIASNGDVRFYYTNGVTSNLLVQWSDAMDSYSNRWAHLVIVINGTSNQSTLYINGVNISTQAMNSPLIPTTSRAKYIGSYQGSSNWYNGSMDEVLIFNRSLSSTEILALYNSKANKFNSTFSSLATGQHNYTLYGIDEAGNINSSTRNFYVDYTSPTYSLNQTNSTTPSQPALFSLYINDNLALNPLGQYIFSTNNTGTWANDSAVNFTTTPQWANVTKVINCSNPMIGYRWYFDDNAQNMNASEIYVITTDVTAPNVTITNSPANNSEYNPLTIFYFNATITDESGVNYINASFNGTSQTIINFTNNDYGFNFSTSYAVGNYEVCWFANDTYGNINLTCYDYTIKLNTSTTCSLTTNSPVTYPNNITVSGSCNNPENGSVLYLNGSATSNPFNDSLGAGIWNFTLISNPTQNYSGNLSQANVLVNPSTSSCSVLFNTTSPLTYLNSFRAYSNCDTSFTLYRNGTSITNNSNQFLGAGLYNFSVSRTDTQNYSNIYDEELFTISQATPPLVLSASPDWEVKYGITSTITGSGCPTQLTCNLYRNSVGVSNPDSNILAIAVYNYTYNTSGNTNYTSASTSNNLNVSIGGALTDTQTSQMTALYNCLIRGIGCAKNKFVYGYDLK